MSVRMRGFWPTLLQWFLGGTENRSFRFGFVSKKSLACSDHEGCKLIFSQFMRNEHESTGHEAAFVAAS